MAQASRATIIFLAKFKQDGTGMRDITRRKKNMSA